MQNIEKYQKILWRWFIDNASMNGQYRFTYLPDVVRNHLHECGIDVGNSTALNFTTTSQWGNTMEPFQKINVIKAYTWACNCGLYSDRKMELGVTGTHSLEDVIIAVVTAEDVEL